MNYGAPVYTVPAATSSSKLKIIIGVVVACVVIFLTIGAIAIALGVGLGVGLKKDKNTSSGLYSILAAPTVNCNYGGPGTCGCSAIKPAFLSPRIVQGYDAVPNSWPWLVAIYLENGSKFCGGFLISYQHVVTAAHCLVGVASSSISVYAGVHTLTQRSSGQVRTVSSYQTHPSFSSSSFDNDIGVITLSSPFNQSSSNVGACCLTSDTSLPRLRETGVIAGWGATSSSSSSISNTLQQATIRVQSDSRYCSSSSKPLIQFCASYSGTDACFGDSGGPFMTSVNNAWTCTGIVSAGRGCGRDSYYTRVSGFRDFIRSNTGI